MKSGQFVIKWSYFQRFRKPLAGEQVKPDQASVPAGIDTICSIEMNEQMFGHGTALCCESDHFSRDKGRKLSLARAMKNALLSKEERSKVWNDYRNMTKNPRWQLPKSTKVRT